VDKIKNNALTFLGYNTAELIDFLNQLAWNLVLSALIILLGFWFTNKLGKFIEKILTKNKTDKGLVTFLSSLAVISGKLFFTLTAMAKLGIAVTSFVTVLGAAGIAIGLAFSGTLSNFAGGIMILVLKPFKVNDTILAQNIQGLVTDILIFNTYVLTDDNKVIILPNGPLINGTIINFTKENKRKLVVNVLVGFGENMDILRKEVEELLSENSMVVKDTIPTVEVTSINEKNAAVAISVWVKAAEFSSCSVTLHELIYRLLNKEGNLVLKQNNSKNEPN
jgi:small conductance mechanosensitive channel